MFYNMKSWSVMAHRPEFVQFVRRVLSIPYLAINDAGPTLYIARCVVEIPRNGVCDCAYEPIRMNARNFGRGRLDPALPMQDF